MKRLLLALTTVSMLVMVVPLSSANAATTEQHCILRVTGTSATGEMTTAPEVCYATFAGAMRSLGVDVSAKSKLNAPQMVAAGILSPQSTFILGVHYDGYNLTGSSTSTVGSNCGGGYLNASPAWNNRIRSTWNGCGRIRHFDGYNLVGSVEDTYTPGGNLTLLAANVSSIQYTT